MPKSKLQSIISYSADRFQFLQTLAKRSDVVGKGVNFVVWFMAASLRKAAYITYKLLLLRRRKKGGGQGNISAKLAECSRQITQPANAMGKRVLIIAELSIPGCRMYRVDQKAMMIRDLDYQATVVSWKNAKACRDALQFHSLVIFYRVPATEKTRLLVQEAKRLRMPVFFEIDDLIFDREEYQKNPNLGRLPRQEQEILLDGADRYGEMLALCEHAIASTKTLGRHLQKHCKGWIHIINNCIDPTIISLEDETPSLFSTPGIITIGYGSGTRTHDTDFEVAADGILAVLKKNKNVRLVIYGPLRLPPSFVDWEAQILRVPFIDRDDYYRSLRNFDINIIPLEKSPFNDAKSNIKYLEASFFRVPSIVSPAASFGCCVHRKNALAATSPSDWESCLEQLVTSQELRSELGENAYTTVMENYHYQTISRDQLLPFLNDWISEKPDSARKKVLFVNVLYKPAGLGGATVVVEEMVREIKQLQAYEPYVFTGFFHAEGAETPYNHLLRYEVEEVPVFGIHLPEIISMEKEYQNPDYKALFSEVLDYVEPDMVHFHSIQKLSASLAESCLEKNIPYVITLHDQWWLCEKQFMINKTGHYCHQHPIDLRICSTACVADPSFTYKRSHYLYDILTKANMLLAPSNYQRNFYLTHGISPDRIKVNENGVLQPGQPSVETPQAQTVHFAYLGGKSHHKGFFLLKKVFERLDNSSFELILVDLHRRTGLAKISPNSLKIKGTLVISDGFDQSEIDDFYANVDVLLFPSLWKESFGLSVREAIARNIWVISTDCGGPAEAIKEGINGNLVPMDDEAAFADAVRSVLKNPERIKSYRHSQPGSVRFFREQAEELQQFYEGILSKG